MEHYLITSEAVSIGHPDKVADQISDAIVDACLKEDPHARVACETLITRGTVILAGEITCKQPINYTQVVRQTLKEIGYDNTSVGMDYRSCGVLVCIDRQSPDIAQGVNEDAKASKEQGAGDQGIMIGYATDETPQYMPLTFVLAQKVLEKLKINREKGIFPFLGPDGKSQITLAYDALNKACHAHTIIISTQHLEEISQQEVYQCVLSVIQECIPPHLLTADTRILVNPTGRFVIGGPASDTGLTGRKLMVDTYGTAARHGGGAFSGKDPSKVDRSAAYMARYIAKHIVAAQYAKQCEVHLAYAIGVSQPVALHINTFGTGVVNSSVLEQAVHQVFKTTPKGIIEQLNLKRPIYRNTAYGGHFGRENSPFPWEQLNLLEPFKERVLHIIEATRQAALHS